MHSIARRAAFGTASTYAASATPNLRRIKELRNSSKASAANSGRVIIGAAPFRYSSRVQFLTSMSPVRNQHSASGAGPHARISFRRERRAYIAPPPTEDRKRRRKLVLQRLGRKPEHAIGSLKFEVMR